ncbi:3-methylmercaptopropionyl-CoA ligase of DmdB1 type [Cupriavidus necator H850]|uniref:AMP-binding protein n=1 Tax=Cupriavidus necator TaxID=106590 RepID=UPI00129D9786|nr:AMP-binding protein [Cupriavidus necator]KAI3596429.1 3-methylmercaptopropionyl-CoA ligase of DmdB1 type [Cupriavidus necator H850]
MPENIALPRPPNFTPLNPVTFLERAARVHGHRPAIVYHGLTRSWAQTYDRCRRLAAAVRAAGVRRGQTVTVMLPNVPAMVEAHFGIPMAGAVLNCLNIRLDENTIAGILRHSETRLIFVDAEYLPLMRSAMKGIAWPVRLVVCADTAAGFDALRDEYEPFLEQVPPTAISQELEPFAETDTICLNYTSGTTGAPKGVLYHYRGAYLNALGNIVTWSMPRHAVYLWTLPMFHCNGWCFPWTVAAVAGVNVCLRKVETSTIFDAIARHEVTHYCGAPIVHNMMVNAPEAKRFSHGQKLFGMVAGAAPTRAMLAAMDGMGIELTHVYGLTEIYGPSAVCERQTDWDSLEAQERAVAQSRQGVRYVVQEELSVRDPETLEAVAADGRTMGEVMFRGNVVMTGYFKDEAATREAFRGGWFHTGDLGVVEPDGYVRLKDRSKDIIISGGENISSIEVEDTLCQHPAVLMAAVVAQPDGKWGEAPVAFVEIKPGHMVSADVLLDFCKTRLAGFKRPRAIHLGTLPKTSTGKIQKFALREILRSTQAITE